MVIWARKILADRDGLNEEITAMRAGLSGQLRLGSVPTASIAASLLTAPFCFMHPLARAQVSGKLTPRRTHDAQMDWRRPNPNPRVTGPFARH